MKIIPAILATNKNDLKKEWQKVAPHFDHLQIDIMDGHFVSSKNNFKPTDLKNLSKRHTLEMHLMVKDLAKYIELWSNVKNVKKIIWHYEAETDSLAIVCLNDYLKKKKIKTGLCLNPETPLSKISKIAKYFDTIQIMGVKPGDQGRPFHPSAIAKIKKLKNSFPKQKIAVDGGINAKNFSKIKKAGADIVIIGSYLQKAPDLKAALQILK